MSTLAIVGAVAVVYAWFVGRVMRHLASPIIAEPHRRDRCGFAMLSCEGDGMFGFDFTKCQRCHDRARSKWAAVFWPLWLATRPFVAVYRAGLGFEHHPHDSEDKLESSKAEATP